jgi:hypothetical protein
LGGGMAIISGDQWGDGRRQNDERNQQFRLQMHDGEGVNTCNRWWLIGGTSGHRKEVTEGERLRREGVENGADRNRKFQFLSGFGPEIGAFCVDTNVVQGYYGLTLWCSQFNNSRKV